MKLDAAESAFFSRQLEEIESDVVRIARPELKARTLIPTVFGGDYSTLTYREFDRVGNAKVISGYADDLPRSDVLGREFTKSVRLLGGAFGYNIDEIRNAKKAGFALERERADATAEVMARLEDQIGAIGSSADNLSGMLNHSAVTSGTATADGAGSSALWSAKTPLQIVRDMNKAVLDIRADTMGVHVPDTLLLSEERFGYISTTPMSSTGDSNLTILKFFMETNAFIQNVEPWYYLNTLGAGATHRMVAYRRDPKFLKQHIPQQFTMLPPEPRNLEQVVNCVSRTAGVTVYYPKVMRYVDGI